MYPMQRGHLGEKMKMRAFGQIFDATRSFKIDLIVNACRFDRWSWECLRCHQSSQTFIIIIIIIVFYYYLIIRMFV